MGINLKEDYEGDSKSNYINKDYKCNPVHSLVWLAEIT